MVVRQAKTEEEIYDVKDYLESKGTVAGNGNLFYVTNGNGKIIGAYCLELKLCIDPVQAESPAIAMVLMTDGLAQARAHTDRVYTLTKSERVKQALKKYYNAILWTKDVDEFVIYNNDN